MGASDSTARGGEQANFLGCCEARGKNVHQLAREPSVRLCGVGMGLDSQLLAAGRVSHVFFSASTLDHM